jgi:hypothetical protein
MESKHSVHEKEALVVNNALVIDLFQYSSIHSKCKQNAFTQNADGYNNENTVLNSGWRGDRNCGC